MSNDKINLYGKKTTNQRVKGNQFKITPNHKHLPNDFTYWSIRIGFPPLLSDSTGFKNDKAVRHNVYD